MFSIRPGANKTAGYVRYPQLDAGIIKDFIEQHSVSIRYWRAMRCPCTMPETGQPNPACHSCRGLGWFHQAWQQEPIFRRAQVHSRSTTKKDGVGGKYYAGSVSITFLPGVIPGDGDIIQVCADIEVINDENHVLGSTLTDGSTAEALRFRDVICVEDVAVYSSGRVQAEMLAKTDWQFDATQRRIIFLRPLPVGTKYSLRYKARPEYMVMEETVKPMLRVSHDDTIVEPKILTTDVVYPFNCQAVRLDRALSSRERGAIDLAVPSTYNSPKGRGPFV
jgi:hypothetical protein